MRSIVWRIVGIVGLVMLLSLGLATRPAFGQSSTNPTLTLTAESTVSYAPGAGPVLVDPGLTITGSDEAMLYAAIVSIGAGFVPAEDALGISGQADTAGTIDDLSWSYDTDTGMLTLSGEATLADYEAALRQVTFSNVSPTALTNNRAVSISLGSAMYYFGNNHFYEFVSAPRGSWTDAQEAAETMTHAGMQGYLVTLTTAGENVFVAAKLPGGGWIGASDEGHNKEWRWKTGPEAGTHFFTQSADEDGCGEGSAATQPPGANYENWNTGPPEPNDFPAGCADGENYASMSPNGLWNDWPNSSAGQSLGYIVEYGGVDGEPTDAPVATIVIQADTPSITIEKAWIGEDPDMSVSFTVIPEVEGCTAEQKVWLVAAETSVEVPVAERSDDADQTACTYAVTESTPVGYTASPDEVTEVAIDGTAAFTNTPNPVEALPTTGSTNSALVIAGFALAGSGWFVLGGGRRHWTRTTTVEPQPVTLLPIHAWTSQAALGVQSPDPHPTPVRNMRAQPSSADVISPPEAEPAMQLPAVAKSAVDEVAETLSKPDAVGAHAIVEDLLQLLEDLAED